MLDLEPLPNSPFNSSCETCKSPGLCKAKAKCLHSAANMFSSRFHDKLAQLTGDLRNAQICLSEGRLAKNALRSRRAQAMKPESVKQAQMDIVRKSHFEGLPLDAQERLIKGVRKAKGVGRDRAIQLLGKLKNLTHASSLLTKTPKQPNLPPYHH
jgi:hypothetical protein